MSEVCFSFSIITNEGEPISWMMECAHISLEHDRDIPLLSKLGSPSSSVQKAHQQSVLGLLPAPKRPAKKRSSLISSSCIQDDAEPNVDSKADGFPRKRAKQDER